MNRNLNAIVLVFAISLLFSCAEIVTKDYKPNKGGVVRYSTGWFLAGKNRSKALSEMNEYCAPKGAHLLGESSKTELTGDSTTRAEGNVAHTTANKEGYVYLRFQCRK